MIRLFAVDWTHVNVFEISKERVGHQAMHPPTHHHPLELLDTRVVNIRKMGARRFC
jgi:hypothetical protein